MPERHTRFNPAPPLTLFCSVRRLKLFRIEGTLAGGAFDRNRTVKALKEIGRYCVVREEGLIQSSGLHYLLLDAESCKVRIFHESS